jgi:hypothetical protein
VRICTFVTLGARPVPMLALVEKEVKKRLTSVLSTVHPSHGCTAGLPASPSPSPAGDRNTPSSGILAISSLVRRQDSRE